MLLSNSVHKSECSMTYGILRLAQNGTTGVPDITSTRAHGSLPISCLAWEPFWLRFTWNCSLTVKQRDVFMFACNIFAGCRVCLL